MSSERVTLRAFGVSIRIGGDATLASPLRCRAASLGWIESPEAPADLEYAIEHAADAPNPTYALRCNGETVHQAADHLGLLDAFEHHLKIELATRAGDRVFVHAGVVGWRGGAIVIPGRSLSGKTTLVAALLRGGAEYYSDEFAILDPAGQVHPYPIPLGIRAAGTRTAMRAEGIGARTGTRPLPVHRIVITQFRVGGRWRPRPVSPALAMLALMDNTVAAQQAPARTMPILRKAAENALALRGGRGEAEATAHALLTLT